MDCQPEGEGSIGMISEQCVDRLLKRLSSLRKFPEDQPSIDDIADALRTGETETAAESFVTEWKSTYPYAPTPADIRTGLQAPDEPTTYWNPPGPVKCEICSDTGWKIIFKGDQSGALRCVCNPEPVTEETEK